MCAQGVSSWVCCWGQPDDKLEGSVVLIQISIKKNVEETTPTSWSIVHLWALCLWDEFQNQKLNINGIDLQAGTKHFYLQPFFFKSISALNWRLFLFGFRIMLVGTLRVHIRHSARRMSSPPPTNYISVSTILSMQGECVNLIWIVRRSSQSNRQSFEDFDLVCFKTSPGMFTALARHWSRCRCRGRVKLYIAIAMNPEMERGVGPKLHARSHIHLYL
jgi:hypothetical protein